jgi:hypothetical protein
VEASHTATEYCTATAYCAAPLAHNLRLELHLRPFVERTGRSAHVELTPHAQPPAFATAATLALVRTPVERAVESRTLESDDEHDAGMAPPAALALPLYFSF